MSELAKAKSVKKNCRFDYDDIFIEYNYII